jgi:hypothetical protein
MLHRGSASKNKFALIIGILAVIALVCASPVSAQSGEQPPDDDPCVTCHENLYMLHDTGKWCCLCALPMHCTCCHGGNPDTPDEELAHVGMVARPVKDDSTVCQDCHPEDHQARIETFASIGGISPMASVIPTECYAEPLVAANVDAVPAILRQEPIEPWRVAGLVLVLLALAVLGVVTLYSQLRGRVNLEG